MRERITIYGNSFIGLYGRTNDRYTLVGRTVPEKFEKYAGTFGTEIVRVSLGDSDLIGVFSAANNNGIVVSAVTTDEELAELKRLVGSGMAVGRLESKFTAVGNNIAVNDNGAIVNPRMPDGDIKIIADVLGVEVVKASVAGYATAGAALLAANAGFIAHPGASEEELGRISDILKVRGGIGTANGGVPFVPLAVIANRRGFLSGELTTGYELHRLAECLGHI